MLVEERGLSSRQTQYVVRTWRLGNLSTPIRVQKLQMALHAKAKAEAGYRFYALYDKIYREDVLAHAYAKCRSNRGAPGVDRQDFAEVEAYGVQKWLGELALDEDLFLACAMGAGAIVLLVSASRAAKKRCRNATSKPTQFTRSASLDTILLAIQAQWSSGLNWPLHARRPRHEPVALALALSQRGCHRDYSDSFASPSFGSAATWRLALRMLVSQPGQETQTRLLTRAF